MITRAVLRDRPSCLRQATAAGLLLAACTRGPDALLDSPSFAISDGAHGGASHFYFLPPLVPQPDHAGAFDPTLAPVVRISANGGLLAELPAPVQGEAGHYQALWHTNRAGLNPATSYRLTVFASGVALGFADVVVLPNGKGLRNVTTGGSVGLVDGRTLPIRFRIEKGAIPEGTALWAYATGAMVASSPAIGPDGTIYTGSLDRHFHAINPDGSVKWRTLLPSFVFASPTIGPDGAIYTASDDAFFYVLNADGSIRWQFLIGTGVRSSPALGLDGTVYVGAGRFFWALNPDGTLKWRFNSGGNNASPAVGPDGTIYAGAFDHRVYALHPDGSLKWSYLTDGIVSLSSPALGDDGTVYLGSEDWHIYALNGDGSLKWRFRTNAAVFSSPALGADGTVYAGSADGWLYALNADGTLQWRYQTGGEVFSSPALGSDGTVYVGSEDGNIYALNADGTLKWSQVTSGPVFSGPALGPNGPLFVTSGNAVHAYRVTDGGLADTPWPKFHHDNRNSGNVVTLIP